ncbi:MAG: pilus assembly protein [Acidobacteria bacterium]|nr:pilus assembly protein [Acidobacteriota bacterium]
MIEFALISFVLYLLMVGTIELGRMMFAAQVLQDVARLTARELAVTPIQADLSFNDALIATRTTIWDPSKLVVDASTDATIDAGFSAANMPVVNRALRPLFITDTIPGSGGVDLPVLRYPGALVVDSAAPLGVTVKIPKLNASGGYDALEVIAEATATGVLGPFSVTNGGIAAVVVNYPFQAASMSGFVPQPPATPGGPPEPNIGYVVEAPAGTPIGTYSGTNGLGAQYAFAKKVRPFRRLLTGQAYFRQALV